jgi:hypothetical protein
MKIVASIHRVASLLKAQGPRIAQAVIRRSDKDRWAEPSNLHESWDERTRILASRIEPNSRVLEFGAGRLVLEAMLPPGCSYTPSDLVARDARTVVCDLNRYPLPDLGRHDVIVFSGVLEYVSDLPRLIRELSPVAPRLLASYAVCTRSAASERLLRRSHGFMTDLDEEQFLAIFHRIGYRPVERLDWRSQRIFDLRRG